MPFNRKTPKQVVDGLNTEIDAAFPNADSRVRFTVENMLARVIAMASHELYGFIDYLSKQMLPITAVAEWLLRHCETWKVYQKVAAPAKGSTQFTGTNGLIIPAGTIVRRSDNAEYSVDADVTVSGGVAIANVTASVAGAAGGSVSGTRLSLTSPIPGVASDSFVTADGLTQGTDIESEDLVRGRLLTRIQNPPHGGAKHDYEFWAMEVPGVTRAWCYPKQYGLGTVGIIFVMDDKVGTIIPSAGEVQAVADYIETVRPVCPEITVIAPTPIAVNFEIHLNPNTLVVQNAVQAELEDFFRRESVPGEPLFLSRINEAISAADGEFDHVLVTPSANVTRTYGQLSTLGVITWGAI